MEEAQRSFLLLPGLGPRIQNSQGTSQYRISNSKRYPLEEEKDGVFVCLCVRVCVCVESDM